MLLHRLPLLRSAALASTIARSSSNIAISCSASTVASSSSSHCPFLSTILIASSFTSSHRLFSSSSSPPSQSPPTNAAAKSSSPSSSAPAAPLIPISQLDLSTSKPQLAKHREFGYVVYESPFHRVVKSLKTVSFASCILSIVSTPVFLFVDQTLPLGLRLGVTTTALAFGVGSTLFLTMFLKSYAIRIFALKDTTLPVDPTADKETQASQQYRMTFQTVNMFGRVVNAQTIHSEVSPLASGLFNNVHVDRTIPIVTPASADGKTAEVVVSKGGEKRDYFVHLDTATNPLIQSLYAKSQEDLLLEMEAKAKKKVAAATAVNPTATQATPKKQE